MFRFTLRDLLAVTAIAGVSLMFGILVLRADHAAEFAGVLAVFTYGITCYGLGRLVR